MNAVELAQSAFTTEHGRFPQSVWSAPGRVNLIGEHTDYNDGFVLPFALPHRTTVATAPRDDGWFSVATLGGDKVVHRAPVLSLAELTPGHITGWAAYAAGVAWALLDSDIALTGADLVIAGDVPTGAGLSSSHSLECAVALALLDIAGRAQDGPDPVGLPTIARLVQRSENEFVGAPTGLLDQTASLCCTRSHVLFFDVRSGDMQQVPFETDSAGLEVLVIDTRANHSHSDSGYGERRRGCERAAEILQVKALRDVATDDLESALALLPEELRPLVRHVVTENERVLTTVSKLRAGRLDEIGPLLSASHTSMRDDYRISCRELDLAVDSAMVAGALGARMTGGGFGGSAIALVRADDRERVEHEVREAFAAEGLTAPRLFTAVPAAGAGRDQ
ncbi:galactokinase [Parasphingorhabdus pacifica]